MTHSRSNGTSGAPVVADQSDLSAHNRLPPEIRDALNNAPLKIGAEACLDSLEAFGSADRVIKGIRRACLSAGISAQDVSRLIPEPRRRLP